MHVDWLLTGRGPKNPAAPTTKSGVSLRQVPIMRWTDISSTAETLRAQLANAEARGYVVVPETEDLSADAFALEIQDDSMVDPQGSPLSLYPGDTVIIDPSLEPRAGSTVLAKDGKKALIRKVRVLAENEQGKSERVALVPLNPDFPLKEVAGDRVIGVMAGIYRRVER